MKKNQSLIFFTFLIIFSGSAISYSQTRIPKNLAPNSNKQLEKITLLRNLNLNRAQVVQIRIILREDVAVRKNLRIQRWKARIALEKEIASSNPNEEAVKFLVLDLSRKFEAFELQNALTELKIRKILTQEQKEMLYRQVEIMETKNSKID